ncbi:YbaN family protein [Gemmatimonadota bacterium]
MLKSDMRKGLLSICGVLAVVLATLGIVLPLLPTTPFLLLAAACFIRSSDRLYRWLIAHKWFGPYIRNYREHRALTLRAKIMTVVLLWITLGFTIFGLIDDLMIRIALILIGSGVTFHVLRYKTLPHD